jgi:hypothetical protein
MLGSGAAFGSVIPGVIWIFANLALTASFFMSIGSMIRTDSTAEAYAQYLGSRRRPFIISRQQFSQSPILSARINRVRRES